MIDKAIFKLPGIHGMLLAMLAFAVARAACVVAQALGLAYAIVNLWGGAALADQVGWIALFAGSFVLRQILASVQGGLLDRYARERANDLREQLLSRTFSAGPALVQREGSASVTQTVIDGIEDVRVYIGLIVPKIVSVVAVPAVLLAVVFALDWVSGVIALVCYPFIILYMVMIGHTARDDAARRHGEFQRMANHFMDSLAGISELKAFGRSRAYEERIFAASERFRALTMKTLRVATLSSTVLDMFATLALAGVAVMLGFRLVEGSIAFLPALAVLIMVPEYFRPIREFASDYHASLDGRSAFSAIRSLLDVSGEKERGEAAERPGQGEVEGAETASTLPTPAGGCAANLGVEGAEVLSGSLGSSSLSGQSVPSLALEGVGFSYPDFPDALRDVNISVSGPCKVGIIGASGSGKSTLMDVLGGFEDPASGRVVLDGRALPTLRGSNWQRRASFIPQDPYIFHATLRENVAFYRPDATDAKIDRAVKLAGLVEVATQLPHGLDTVIGQGARSLSGGQAHRVALARAFLDAERTVLLLDEPTAHLDIETELELKERMLPLMEGKLVFFATHRLHWMEQMDYVVELEGGRVAWQGSADAWRARRAQEAAEGLPCVGEAHLPGEAEGFLAEVSPELCELSSDDAARGACVACAFAATEDAAQTGGEGTHEDAAAPAARNPIGRALDAWAKDTWVKPFFRRYWRVLALALLLGLVAAAFAGALMFTSGYMISLAATLPFTVLAVHVPSLYVRIFGVGKPALGYLERLTSHDWALRMTSELRRRLYRDVESASVGARATRRAGEMLGLLAEDIEHVQNLYLRTVFPLVIAWALYVLAIIALGVFDVAAALALALCLGVVVLVLPVVSLLANGARLEKAKAVKASLYAELTDNVLGVADWVYAGRGDEYLERHRALQREADALDVAVGRFGRWRDVAAQVSFAAAAVMLLAWAGAEFSPSNPAVAGASGALAAMTPENAVVHAGNWIAAFVLCLFPLIEYFLPASEAAMGLVTYGDSIERMNALSLAGTNGAAGARSRDERMTVESGQDCSCKEDVADGHALSSTAVAFDGVAFAYPGSGHSVISGLDLCIPAGQKLAVLGRSGAGKSTLASLLHGDFAVSEGRVTVMGRDASALGDDAALLIGVIGQSPHLFNWTLRENLAIAKPAATDAELAAVLEKVGLGDLLARLPQGLDTMVDERGRRFSGGERHRIALARVLLADTPVVVLDEPFAGLDPVTEQALLDTIFDVLAERTVIMITHHLQGVFSCDRVVFVEGGRIALDGAPVRLARESARFRGLLAADAGR